MSSNNCNKKTRKNTAIDIWKYVDQKCIDTASLELSTIISRAKEAANKPQNAISRPFPAGYAPLNLTEEIPFAKRVFTQTNKTKVEYRKRAESLIHRFLVDPEFYEKRNAYNFLLWLLVRKQIIATNTWKVDRAALIAYFKNDTGSPLHEHLVQTDNVGGKKQNKKRLDLKSRTSEKKLKYIRHNDLVKLINSFSTKASDYWSSVAINIFAVMYSTGIRPLEITQSKFIYTTSVDGKLIPALKVENAKHTNGRGNGDYRTIPLDRVEGVSLENIKKIVEMSSRHMLANGKPTEPEKYTKKASEAFSKHIKRVFPNRTKNITLSSTRHQFAADAKRSGMKPAEIAALLGHVCDRTAYIHYAKSTRGRKSSRIPKPLFQETASVRVKYIPPTNEIGSALATKTAQYKGTVSPSM